MAAVNDTFQSNGIILSFITNVYGEDLWLRFNATVKF
jgi:hypothetical protein